MSAEGLICISPVVEVGSTGKSYSITVKLSEADTAVQSPSCTWIFDSVTGGVTETNIDLGRIDGFSTRIATEKKEYLADHFMIAPEFSLKKNMVVEVMITGSPFSRDIICKEELTVPLILRESLLQRTRQGSAPTIEWFFIELTNSCNFHCQWCPETKMSRPTGQMSLEKAKRLLDNIKFYRNKRPIFSFYSEIHNPIFLHVMGEPLLHPELFEILDYGHMLGLSFCLVTNTSLLNPQIVTRLIESKIEGVVLSLNACDEESFRATGASVSYQTCVEQAQSFIAERLKSGKAFPRIEIQLLNTKNAKFHEVSAVNTQEQVEKALIDWYIFVREQERRFSTAPYPLDLNAQSEWRSSLDQQTITVGRYFPIGHEISLVFKTACNFGNALLQPGYAVELQLQGRCPFMNAHKTLCVFWDGSCSYCTLDYDSSVKLGNVFDSDIESIWSGEKMSRIRACMDSGILMESLCRRCQGAVYSTRAS
jgi:wyosine [tRNA(Phe)-imidazoG37] synthetase (radical SAM superfamily)